MSEEIDNAAINVPRAMLTTMILNGATGYAMVLAVLFSLGDIKSIIVSYLAQGRASILTTVPAGHPNWISFHPGLL